MSNHHQRYLARGAEIVLASHNVGKLREFRLLLKESGIIVHSAAERYLPEPEETADSFEGNAAIKAFAAAKATGFPALADDSGFCVEALNGAPGIYSARWAGPERDMMQAMMRVHNEMIQSGSANKKAAFKVVLCLAWPDGVMRHVTGACEGDIIWPPRGTKGHGYDPMFIPNGESRSFAEMSEEEKNLFSHRGKAMQIFLRECVV